MLKKKKHIFNPDQKLQNVFTNETASAILLKWNLLNVTLWRKYIANDNQPVDGRSPEKDLYYATKKKARHLTLKTNISLLKNATVLKLPSQMLGFP